MNEKVEGAETLEDVSLLGLPALKNILPTCARNFASPAQAHDRAIFDFLLEGSARPTLSPLSLRSLTYRTTYFFCNKYWYNLIDLL